ncbi:MAG TPA: SH3 domain-containing protein [Stellaceae bacterium]|nr:SH3 domain-containing protein [Stellaceae bacterium]
MARGRWVKAVAGLLAVAIWIPWAGMAVAASASDVVPRFASLHADKVFLRKGPGDRYPVDWVFVRRGWPVEILGGFDHWRHVRDWQGTDGWVHEKMIATRREVVVTGDIRGIRQGPDTGAALLARAEPGVVAQLIECRAGWCRIEAGDIAGWIERSNIWGVSPTEAVP